MPDVNAIDERLRTIERALTDDAEDLEPLADAATLATRVEEIEGRVDEIEDRLDDLDAATQALRGYVGNVRSVNRDVERRADAALAKAEQLEGVIGERDDGYDRASEQGSVPSEVTIPDETNETGSDHGDQRTRDSREPFDRWNGDGENPHGRTCDRYPSHAPTGGSPDGVSQPRTESRQERPSEEAKVASARRDEPVESQEESGDGLLAELRQAL